MGYALFATSACLCCDLFSNVSAAATAENRVWSARWWNCSLICELNETRNCHIGHDQNRGSMANWRWQIASSGCTRGSSSTLATSSRCTLPRRSSCASHCGGCHPVVGTFSLVSRLLSSGALTRTCIIASSHHGNAAAHQVVFIPSSGPYSDATCAWCIVNKCGKCGNDSNLPPTLLHPPPSTEW